ncbi:hypothetical protein B0T16DRAFT_5609 [Cercophora newfieldiana]|uniref:Protein kinase domain-containing protein n=1 Tax=Cercophora newfieldiana TaxID=92897 RepID=A0AA40CYF9_9PEZI|nr:hypothetical protein B0T16DRAFT_5609 [Cercophora newfieldiana]
MVRSCYGTGYIDEAAHVCAAQPPPVQLNLAALIAARPRETHLRAVDPRSHLHRPKTNHSINRGDSPARTTTAGGRVFETGSASSLTCIGKAKQTLQHSPRCTLQSLRIWLISGPGSKGRSYTLVCVLLLFSLRQFPVDDVAQPLSVFRPAQDQEGEKTREQWLHAQGLVAAIVRVLKGSPSKLQFNRVLAWGGCGLVALFDVGAPSAVGQVVVKCELSASRVPFEKEKQCHDFLRRSKHIVQRVKLQLDPINQSPAHTTSQARPADDNLLILEFLRRGDLNKYLTKLAAKFLKAFEELEQKMAKHGGNLPQDYVLQNLAPTEFPDEVLWLIFEFLFKGVIGILAPPKVRPEYDETGGDDGPLVDETPPDRNMPLERQDIVHFDLDPRNVLIGSFDHVPIHKISDLGHMKPMRDLKADSQQYEEMWSSRLRGKPRIYWLTPEQFSQEWDRISHHPRDAPPPGVRVAGNYSWKTNLYAIGQIMWCLITRFEPPPPRYATQIDTGDGDFEDINTKKWSYGAYLLQGNFDHVDSDLRNLVVECMMDDPADRPRMHKMWKVIQKKTAGDLDKYVKEWCADFYSEALVALPHTSEKLQEWLNNNFDFGVLFPNKSFGRSQSATPPSPFAKGGAPAAP